MSLCGVIPPELRRRVCRPAVVPTFLLSTLCGLNLARAQPWGCLRASARQKAVSPDDIAGATPLLVLSVYRTSSTPGTDGAPKQSARQQAGVPFLIQS